MVSYRVLITGSREWSDEERMIIALRKAREAAGDKKMIIVHGGARGADRMAGKFASISPNAVEEIHEANWKPLGYFDPQQGHVRNQKMVDLRADVCLAFYKLGAGNRGTEDCAVRAGKAGIPVVKIWSDETDISTKWDDAMEVK